MAKAFRSFFVLLLLSNHGFSQEPKKDVDGSKTKMEVFTSRTGTITKLIDTNLPNLKETFGFAETRIREVRNGNLKAYFYQIVKEGKYNNTIASIEYSDLIEVIKALRTLKADVDNDIVVGCDYLENRFVTSDGFQIGYYVNKGKAVWFLKLERFGSDNTLFIKDLETLEQAFSNAKAKIDELKGGG